MASIEPATHCTAPFSRTTCSVSSGSTATRSVTGRTLQGRRVRPAAGQLSGRGLNSANMLPLGSVR
jgi:hypothetical protein